jgi:ABC-type amino acid transport substrate-binding protein
MKNALQKALVLNSFRSALVSLAILSFVVPAITSGPAAAAALDRIKEAGKITFGYRTDARPFSYQNESGKASGYSADLCQTIAAEVKSELGLSSLAIEWVPVALPQRFEELQQGKVDLLCGADTATLARRKMVSFSIPIFPGGIGGVMRTKAEPHLAEVLTGQANTQPIWRGSPARILDKKTFAVVKGTTAEKWLADRISTFEITASVVTVETYEAGINLVLDRDADVLFGDRAILLDAAAAYASSGDLMVLDRQFTYEPIAIALPRGDEDLRLIVDRALSRLFASPDIRELYRKWFGAPDVEAVAFFKMTVVPE